MSATPLWPTTGAPSGNPPSDNLVNITNYYVQRLITQYRAKPKAQGTIAILVKQSVADDMVTQISTAYRLSTAVGAQLDILGKYIGLSRNIGIATSPPYFEFYSATTGAGDGIGFRDGTNPATNDTGVWYSADNNTYQTVALPDSTYRIMLQFKVILNSMDGTLASIVSLLNLFFPGQVYVTDNQNMTLTYNVSVNLPISSALLQAYLPKPMGVGISAINFFGTLIPRVTSDGSTRVTSDGSTRVVNIL